MRNRIRHNYPSLIHCLWAFQILLSAYLLFRCYYYNYYKNPKTFIFTVATVTITIIPLLLPNTLLQILKNILWLPLCRINKFGLNILPSKDVAIPYTCGLSYVATLEAANEGVWMKEFISDLGVIPSVGDRSRNSKFSYASPRSIYGVY